MSYSNLRQSGGSLTEPICKAYENSRVFIKETEDIIIKTYRIIGLIGKHGEGAPTNFAATLRQTLNGEKTHEKGYRDLRYALTQINIRNSDFLRDIVHIYIRTLDPSYTRYDHVSMPETLDDPLPPHILAILPTPASHSTSKSAKKSMTYKDIVAWLVTYKSSKNEVTDRELSEFFDEYLSDIEALTKKAKKQMETFLLHVRARTVLKLHGNPLKEQVVKIMERVQAKDFERAESLIPRSSTSVKGGSRKKRRMGRKTNKNRR